VKVRDLPPGDLLSVDPETTIAEVARQMRTSDSDSVAVMSGGRLVGIITERDILVSLGAGQDPDGESVGDHLTREVVYAAPDWSLEEAAVAMVQGGFRHLIVLERGETVGILSVRDVVRCWTEDGAICPVPASAAVG